MRFVVFLDALDYNDLSPWLKEKLIAKYNPGVPKVTPNVVSQIMTGNRPEDMNFVRSTPYKKPRETDIKGDTILHYAANKGLRVFQYGIPLCANVELPKGSVSTFDHFLGQQNVPPVLQFAKDNMNMMDDDPELVFHAYVDQTSVLFSTIRSIARNKQFDIMFIGFQPIDAYTHWYHQKNRRRLIQVVEEELKDLSRYGPVFFFSDHGGTEKKETFFINKWLAEKGYLVYDINYKLNKFHMPEDVKFPDQITLQHQHVWIDWSKTKFFCNDAFDAMVDKTDNATNEDVQKVRKELMETGHFNSVKLKEEIFDKNGKKYSECPEIMPDAKEGVMVSCNLHEKAGTKEGKSMDMIRNGWHSDRGVVGCSDTTLQTTVKGPRDIYHLMKEFIDKELEVGEFDKKLEQKSIFVVREALKKFKNPAILYSTGKDSTAMLQLVKDACLDGKLPPVVHLDTGYKFKEMYDFRDKVVEKMGFKLIIAKNEEAKATPSGEKFKCCNERKTEALKKLLKKEKFDALFVGIRRDEHGIRNIERYMSPRNNKGEWEVAKEKAGGDSGLEALQDTELAGWSLYSTDFGDDCNHVRVHPLLHWTELDVWKYLKEKKAPINPLYFSREGKRYRSLGCVPCTKPIRSRAKTIEEIVRELKETQEKERSGRSQDKENASNMERLRALGYM